MTDATLTDTTANLPCPTCGARGTEPCTTFNTIRPGVFGPRYRCEPHALRPIAETYWHAVSNRLALLDTASGTRHGNRQGVKSGARYGTDHG